ncbi:MAG: LytTR family DNA-binding domain-containing protein [Bacteroidota bacterium]|nr:LytTR family DNA-binding domain-containing protein [Bacteroidota bacterium]
MKSKAIIVDDEPMARSFLERYCEKIGNIEVCGSFPSAETALDFLKANEIDILFLDVEMPGSNGFQLLDQLQYMPKIILISSKTEYAFDAFQYNVVDYLKKPFTYNRFQQATHKTTELNINLKPEAKQQEIFIKSEGKFTRLNYSDILYIESVGDYVKYITVTRQYLTHSTLKAVEEKMDGDHFLKVHRSYIVNLHKIKDIQDYSLVIEGKVIPISKVHRPDIMQRIKVV